MDTAKGMFIISHSSALGLFRQPGFRWYLEQGRRDAPVGPCWDISTSRVLDARNADGCVEQLTLPVHIMAGDDYRGRKSELGVVHRHDGCFPPQSLVSIGNGLLAVSPEPCLVQLASELPAVDLAVVKYIAMLDIAARIFIRTNAYTLGSQYCF